MEQFTATSQRCLLTVQSVPAATKDIFVWIVGPRRSAKLRTILTAPSRNNLTYLLTYLLCALRGKKQPGEIRWPVGRRYLDGRVTPEDPSGLTAAQYRNHRA